MVSTTLLKSKDTRSRGELAAFLEHLAARVREGRLSFQQADGTLDVALPETLRVDVELVDSVKPTRSKRELEVEIWWEVDDVGTPVESSAATGGLLLT